jgi:hypothetical protein
VTKFEAPLKKSVDNSADPKMKRDLGESLEACRARNVPAAQSS